MAVGPRVTRCPSCFSFLSSTHTLHLAGGTVHVFQCARCREDVDFCGERVSQPLTFVLGADGIPLDLTQSQRPD